MTTEPANASPADDQPLTPQYLAAQGFALDDLGRVGDLVGSLWERRDDLVAAMEWVRDNQAALLNFAQQVPRLVATAGDGIAKAGESAQSASAYLVGGEGVTSASEIAEVASRALASCQDELAATSALLTNLGDELDDLAIPTIAPKYSEVMGVKIVSGVDVGKTKLVDQAASKVRDGAAKVDAIAQAVEIVADRLRGLGAGVTEAGHGIAKAGELLNRSGSELSTLMNFAEANRFTDASWPTAGADGATKQSGTTAKEASQAPKSDAKPDVSGVPSLSKLSKKR